MSCRHARVIVLATALLSHLASSALADTFTNPLAAGADPWVTQWKGQYLYTRTVGGDVRLARNADLTKIGSTTSQVLFDPPATTAYGNNIWAPELHRLNGKWYMYFAADDGTDANHRMYVLEGNSQDPQGTYTFKGQISIPSNRWAIDGTVFSQGGKNYFIWSGRTNGTTVDSGGSQSLYIAEMSNPWTLTGNRTRISSPTFAWETHGHPVNEGPEILRHGNDVFLTYSASSFETTNYALGALKLTGSNPLLASSWTKFSSPIFDQGNGITGTGHASFVKSPDGTQDWIVYHGRTDPAAARQLFMQPFGWNADGTPAFGDPITAGSTIQKPSGSAAITYIANNTFDRTDVTINSTTGKAAGISSYRITGQAGVISNTGRYFTMISDGDGPQAGYLGVAQASSISQDIGPIHAGTYSFSAGFAISSDEAAIAAANPSRFRITLKSVGLKPDGTANEADQVLLGTTEFSTGELNSNSFSYFDVDAAVLATGRVGTVLRIGIESIQPTSGAWSVKMSNLNLDYSTTVPEPATLAAAGMGAMLCRQRRPPRKQNESPQRANQSLTVRQAFVG